MTFALGFLAGFVTFPLLALLLFAIGPIRGTLR